MSNYDTLPLTFPRRRTRPVRVGNVTIGGGHPVVVQSMITEETRNVQACVRQIMKMHRAGAEIVRVTTPSLEEAHCLGEIQAELRKRLVDVPLVADVHHQGTKIAQVVAEFVDKVRLNPGLFVFRRPRGRAEEYGADEIAEEQAAIEESLLPVIEVCKRRDIAMRIGVNHGSLAERMLVTHGDTPEGMVESALEYLRLCEKHGYRNLVISLKASRVPIMVAANRLMVKRMEQEGMDYPLHLGVTEAGDGEYARVKSTAGIATLLAEGIGDTIRVSLSEDPVNELPVCYEILQALGLRKTQVEYVACPSCGRTKFDLPTVLNQVRDATRHLVGLDIAVMGCFPPGETVITESGFSPIEGVEVGQRVLTDRGDFAPVSAVETHEFSGDLVAIGLRGAPSLRVTPNHPVLALERAGRVKGGRTRWERMAGILDGREARWVAAGEIRRDHVLLYPVVQGECDVTSLPEDPDTVVDDDFLTLAGCFAAEGSIGGRAGAASQAFFTFGGDEGDLAERVRGILCRMGISSSVRHRPERNTWEAMAHCAPFAGLCARLFGRGAQNKRLPQWMLTLPKSRQAVLLRALWQCDGYVGTVRGYPRATYVTVSGTLAYQVHQMLLRQGIPAALARRQPARVNRKAVYSVSVTSTDALRRFAAVLSLPVAVPDQGRERTARLALDDRYLYLPVSSLGAVPYAGTVHNLEVAGAGTYVSSLAVVHNCIVNGPGEMADADYGYVGKGGGQITLYRKRDPIKTVPQEQGVEQLIALIRADGKWQEPPAGSGN
ncbi:MAG TPA: (E)-4-hydroxy-3-methylbut-2-enyl-diphosphate synthase [Armatimonadaceae bacterium]|nr:(E)-4-hydroxy-3-methylbut-2-enyl-diphosphate synthase [Armatimonadaceae bacterium]